MIVIPLLSPSLSFQEIKRQKTMVREQHKLEELRILDYVKEKEVSHTDTHTIYIRLHVHIHTVYCM